ncbi:hypothetical protein NIES4072_70300 [Nostoc commune NIES-4072]|uniref:Uncharacterized protein n=1 Tax=Nostoc commune NIES-4072 TaxID=2005467 RepID=A0A2R5G0T1_NOSCO|nr:hypothetical protein [Nostoc commune]BBD70663.1 hypothetical protein NIES4070_70740 [Nostoc commune HK-02]GBG23318.1 hypothetical protein NIES4072_70300 [Nostoc commune NIES-4072]
MTHPKYTQQALSRYTLPRLKRIAAELSVTPTLDKRATETWVNAIITHQSTQLQKVDNQALAQAELDNYIATQAQVVAPELLTIVEISFDHHEYYAGNQLIASITHDDDHLTQRWVVMVNEKEVFRTNTVMRCHRYISIHYKDGTLSVQEEALRQGGRGAEGKEFVQEISSAQELKSTTGNEVMAQIFNECEKYGFEILDDGIYQNDQKLGEVGCTDLGWWFTRAADETQQRIPCDSAMDAVWWLSMVESVPHAEAAGCEELLDRPFEMLTNEEWGQLREYEPALELVAA